MAPGIIAEDKQNGTQVPLSKQQTASGSLYPTGLEARLAARNATFQSVTAGVAPGHIQANMIILPSRYAEDFRILCKRNPVPCPLLAESKVVGQWDELKSWMDGISANAVAADIDLRKDAPAYTIYKDGKLVEAKVTDITKEWTEDHVAFLIGCSYSFETALSAAGLTPRHVIMGRNCSMYRSNISLSPAGVFTGSTFVVSMRPYKKSEIEAVRDITRPFVATHGEPVAWGWDGAKKLGIEDINQPVWGDQTLTLDGKPLTEGDEDNFPVFWGCGVTPQEAVMRANLEGTIMGHAPGHMLVLDVTEKQLFGVE